MEDEVKKKGEMQTQPMTSMSLMIEAIKKAKAEKAAREKAQKEDEDKKNKEKYEQHDAKLKRIEELGKDSEEA